MTLLTTTVDFQTSVLDAALAPVAPLPVENPPSDRTEEVLLKPSFSRLSEMAAATEGRTMTRAQILEASRLIIQISQTQKAGGRFIGWSLALNRQGSKDMMRRMLRANPALRDHLRRVAPGNDALESALSCLRRAEIGVEVPTTRWRMRGQDVETAKLAIADLNVMKPLLVALRLSDGTGALVRDVNGKQSHVLNSVLTSVGNALVDEHIVLRQRIEQDPQVGKLLHNLVVEEPLISQGIRERIAQIGMAPSLGDFFEDLHVSWNVDCQLAATDRSEAALQLVAADGESLI